MRSVFALLTLGGLSAAAAIPGNPQHNHCVCKPRICPDIEPYHDQCVFNWQYKCWKANNKWCHKPSPPKHHSWASAVATAEATANGDHANASASAAASASGDHSSATAKASASASSHHRQRRFAEAKPSHVCHCPYKCNKNDDKCVFKAKYKCWKANNHCSKPKPPKGYNWNSAVALASASATASGNHASANAAASAQASGDHSSATAKASASASSHRRQRRFAEANPGHFCHCPYNCHKYDDTTKGLKQLPDVEELNDGSGAPLV